MRGRSLLLSFLSFLALLASLPTSASFSPSSSSSSSPPSLAASLPTMTAGLPRTLLSLLDDLLLIILDCLPNDSDRRSWRLVCTLFLLLESRHRRSLAVRCRELLLPLVCLRYPLLHRLDFSRCPGVDDRALVLAFSQPGSLPLRALNLSSAFSVTFRGLGAAVRACPRLQEIDVSNCWRLGDREVAAISGAAAAGLTSLNMARCLAVTDVGLAKVAVGGVRRWSGSI